MSNSLLSVISIERHSHIHFACDSRLCHCSALL